MRAWFGRAAGRASGAFALLVVGFATTAGAALAIEASLPVPQVQAPSTPSVPLRPSVPDLPSAPPVTLPQAPAVPAPVPRPTLPPVSAPGAGLGQAAPAGTTGASEATVGTTVTQTSAAATGRRRASAGPGATGRRARARALRRQAARRRARARSFRKTVRRHAPCFYALSGLQRRVLALRAGLNGASPRSRTYVARELKRSRRSIGRSEQVALDSLRDANRDDDCAMSAGERAERAGMAMRRLSGTGAVAVAGIADGAGALLLAAADGGDGDRGAVAGAERSSEPRGDRGDQPKTAGPVVPAGGLANVPGDGVDPALTAALAATAALLAFGLVAMRRRGNHWSAAEGDVSPAPWSLPLPPPKKPETSETHGSPTPRHGRARRLRTRNRG